MWMRFEIWRSDVKQAFWRKISKFAMNKAYPWYDYSSFYAHMQGWLEYASKRYTEQGVCVGSERVAKQMLIASEICRRLSTGYVKDNAYNVVFGPEYLSTILPPPWTPTDEERRKYKQLRKVEERDQKYYLELLFQILNKHSLMWWD